MLYATDEKITLRVQTLVAIFVIFFISLMFSWITITFFSQHSAMAQSSLKTVKPLNATTTANNWPTYENDTMGIKKLQYPSNWKKIVEDKSTIRFSPLLENRTTLPIANFSIQALPSQNLALEDLVSLDLIKYRQSFTDFTLNESRAIRLADNSAYKVVFQHKDGLNSFKAMQLWTIIGDKTFIIKYTSQLDEYPNYLSTVQLMIDSLRIQGTRIAGASEINRLGLLGQRIVSDPYYITMNTVTKKIYIANYRYDTVSVLNSSNDRVVATVPVGNCPDAIDINEVNNRIYVANDCSPYTVSVIDGATNKVVGNITGVGTKPEDVAVDQKEGGFNSLIFIANYGSNTVSVIDGTTNKVVGTIGVGDKPGALAINQVTNRLYVVNSDSNRIDVIDYFIMKKGGVFKPSAIANITVGSFPDAVYLNSDVNMLYVSNRHSNTISVINGTTNKVENTIEVGSAPYYLDGNPITNKIYVANYGSNTVSVIDSTTNKVVSNITVGYQPYALHVDLSSNIIYVANLGSTVSEINGATNKILVGITFSVVPKDGGYVQCDRLYGSNLYVRDEIGKDLNCEAIPAANYRFSTWSGSMTSNLDVNNPKIKLNLSRYGVLTSHFIVPVNISIPPEYFLSLYGIVLGIILPPLIGLYFVRRARKNLGKYMKKIDKVYDSLRQDEAKSSHRLIRIREEIIKALEKGNINESHYGILEDRISKYLDELSKSK
jgi:YVTN family beta-propeller protein